MANIFSNPTYKSNIGFNEFPIRQHKQFSSTVGHILPVYFDYLKPGDKVSCGCDIKTRFQPMVAPAFVNIEEHVDWFFVPLKQIYEPITQLLYGIQDFSSDMFNKDSDSMTLPQFGYRLLGEFFNTAFAKTGQVFNDVSADDAVILRSLDHFGFPVKYIGSLLGHVFDSGDIEDYDFLPSLPVWFAGAYQKIWSDHYRLSDWQENDPWLYNFDSFQTGTSLTEARFRSCFTLHRIPFKRDYNTYVLPSPVFGSSDFNAYGNPVSSINQWLTKLTGATTINEQGNQDNTNPTQVSGLFGTSAAQTTPAGNILRNDFNPANIRTLFAAEKFLEITRRAGKHYDAQVLAHYGINVPTGLDGESMFLGGMQQDVMVTDIFATAETEYSETSAGQQVGTTGTPLGKMAGKAFGNIKNGGINFTAKCEGILMAVYYALPNVIYEQTGYDPLNRLVRVQDFYNPQFDDLGMQPCFQLYRSLLNSISSDDVYISSDFSSWQWRYMELKSKPNIAFGSFIGSMKPWSLTKIADSVDWDFLTVNSDFLNGLMVVDFSDSFSGNYIANAFSSYYNGDFIKAGEYIVNGIYDRDPMLHDCMFYVNKVSKMSKFGIGSL